MKLCECGCGDPAPISDRTHKRYGWDKGKPKRFIFNHHRRIKNTDDLKSYIEKDGKRVHIIICEKAIGKKLPKGSVVHHVNRDIQNGEDPELVLCQDHSYHALLHVREMALEKCGNPNHRRCCFCKVYDDPNNMTHLPKNRRYYHKKCNAKFFRNYRNKKGGQN